MFILGCLHRILALPCLIRHQEFDTAGKSFNPACQMATGDAAQQSKWDSACACENMELDRADVFPELAEAALKVCGLFPSRGPYQSAVRAGE